MSNPLEGQVLLLASRIVKPIAVFLCLVFAVSAYASKDTVFLAGRYLAAVYMFDELMRSECAGHRPSWRRNIAKSEKWVFRLLDKDEQKSFTRDLPEIHKLLRNGAKTFVAEKFPVMLSKSSSRDRACGFTVDMFNDDARKSEQELVIIERRLHGTQTPSSER